MRDAPTLDAARAAADRLINTFDRAFPAAVACFRDDLDALLAIHRVHGHLTHEENDALPLIDAYATPEVMQRFGLAHSNRIGAGVSRYLPWLLDSASAERTSAALATLPDPVRLAYLDEWQPAYAALNLWAARQRPLSPGSAARG